jgi:diaminopimelate decarboxylase
VLNLGGGFGIAYTSVDEPTPIADLAEGIVEAVARECEVRGIPLPNLAFEPGRTIVGRAGVTLYEVGTVKPVAPATTSPALRERRRRHERQRPAGAVRRAVLGAPRLAHVGCRARPRPRRRPSLRVRRHRRRRGVPARRRRPGDLLAVPATGAYCFSLSSNYNYVPRPPVVAVLGAARPA